MLVSLSYFSAPQALPLYERALQGREALLGAHHPDTSASAINLAVALEAVGELKECTL